MDEKFFREVLSNVKCGRCGEQCEPTNVELLGQQEELWLLSVYCPACESRGVVVASVKEDEAAEISEVSEPEMDASPAEVDATMDKSGFTVPVTSDDVIDMYVFMKDFGGDFTSLFSENKVI